MFKHSKITMKMIKLLLGRCIGHWIHEFVWIRASFWILDFDNCLSFVCMLDARNKITLNIHFMRMKKNNKKYGIWLLWFNNFWEWDLFLSIISSIFTYFFFGFLKLRNIFSIISSQFRLTAEYLKSSFEEFGKKNKQKKLDDS